MNFEVLIKLEEFYHVLVGSMGKDKKADAVKLFDWSVPAPRPKVEGMWGCLKSINLDDKILKIRIIRKKNH